MKNKLLLSLIVFTSVSYTHLDTYSLENVTLNEGLKYIDKYAFYNCENLKAVNIPDTVTFIGQSSFYGCVGLSLSLIHI